MLILSRKFDETIVIDTGTHIIEVIVREIRGRRVELAVDATEDVRICRGESNGR